jgi:hypothetical protein
MGGEALVDRVPQVLGVYTQPERLRCRDPREIGLLTGSSHSSIQGKERTRPQGKYVGT